MYIDTTINELAQQIRTRAEEVLEELGKDESAETIARYLTEEVIKLVVENETDEPEEQDDDELDEWARG